MLFVLTVTRNYSAFCYNKLTVANVHNITSEPTFTDLFLWKTGQNTVYIAVKDCGLLLNRAEFKTRVKIQNSVS